MARSVSVYCGPLCAWLAQLGPGTHRVGSQWEPGCLYWHHVCHLVAKDRLEASHLLSHNFIIGKMGI